MLLIPITNCNPLTFAAAPRKRLCYRARGKSRPCGKMSGLKIIPKNHIPYVDVNLALTTKCGDIGLSSEL